MRKRLIDSITMSQSESGSPCSVDQLSGQVYGSAHEVFSHVEKHQSDKYVVV